MFKNNKPFFKYSLPGLPVSPTEYDIWKNIDQKLPNYVETMVERLKNLPFLSLSSRSQHLLDLNENKREEYLLSYINNEPIKITVITCMTVLKKTSQDIFSIACPVIGTEAGIIYILDPQNFSLLLQANVSHINNVPFIICATGLFDVNYKIVIATRENRICLLKKGWIEGKIITQCIGVIVDMIFIPGENLIVIATKDKMIYNYTKTGQKLWQFDVKESITSLCLVTLLHLNVHLIAVALKSGLIQLYQGRRPVDFITVPDTPSSITFGQLGQEENVMIIVTTGGAIIFKILKRTANFNLVHEDNNMPLLNQNKSLPLPKRSKLFLELSMRERDDPVAMHRNFQQDLIRLRLTAAREMTKITNFRLGNENEKKQIKLSAQVMGLGPKFTVILNLENTSTEVPMIGITVVFHVKPEIYKLSSYIFKVPLIPPTLTYKLQTNVTQILPVNNNEETQLLLVEQKLRILRVFVIKNNHGIPILAATINMPTTDLIF